ncbi:hypothetical protein A9267_10045 [Shewanella sp. UCD-FRSSP16_17]|uniref:J domain-containing protein n=1 Tax=Shewanella sp. UCD-FRSSP16_17 TaxID=1853256 RepID=UPI0007EEB8D4|nr:J domain-containing protein [Shewanella sp. UCD-FRSSP16_17]OBT08058.1 hypothetical protein A9267_10045 [Shewanella sp. UCD-FRSSP16_17]
MGTGQNYYAVLGILPTAELVVIKAAYKAMMKVYHPDKYHGSKEYAHQKCLEISEAYRVLSDLGQKAEYDAGQDFSFTQEDESGTNENSNTASHALDDDWNIAAKYQPNIKSLEASLRRISVPLAFSFRAKLLEEKLFNDAKELANQMENRFLTTYFGTNPKIKQFAIALLVGGHRGPAKELNKVVTVLGSQINADSIIKQICDDFKLNIYSSESSEVKKTSSTTSSKSMSGSLISGVIIGGTGLIIISLALIFAGAI